MEGKVKAWWKPVGVFLFCFMLISAVIESRSKGSPFVLSPIPDKTGFTYTESRVQSKDAALLSCESVRKTSPCMFILNKKEQYVIGDTITVGIVLKTKRGVKDDQPDFLLLWMEDRQHGASSAGSVVYHGQGKYTGTLKALWSGSVTIRVAVRASAEGYNLLVETMENRPIGKPFNCIFQYLAYKETTKALIYPSEGIISEKTHCNLTLENYGYPLYCVKPTNKALHCTDWTQVQSLGLQMETLKLMGQNKYDTMMRGTTNWTLPGTAKLTIVSNTDLDMLRAEAPCTKSHFLKTWTESSPLGFYYKNKWYSTLCSDSLTQDDVLHCLGNRSVRMYGDSTVRQLYVKLIQIVGAKILSGTLTGRTLHRPSAAIQTKHNISFTWNLHGIPLSYEPYYRGTTRPIHASLDLLPANINDIILVHIFAHFALHHPNVFRAHMSRIAESAKSLLARAPRVRIAVKPPHSMSGENEPERLTGVIVYLYRQIIREEFREIMDRIIFLGVWDTTVSVQNKGLHPHSNIVKAMVDDLLRFSCVA